jgi:hypothetical protein
MPGTSPSGLNQTEIKHLAATTCKRGELHIRRQLERRKSTSPPIRRCQSHSPALCQRHQGLPNKRVGHVSFPTKRQKRCIIYYARYIPTLATYKVSRDLQRGQQLGEAHASEVHASGVHTPLKDTTPKHQITTTIQLPTLFCDVGPTCSYPHISTASAGLTHSGERRSTKKESSRK